MTKEGQVAFLKEYAKNVEREYEDVAEVFDELAENPDKALAIVKDFCQREQVTNDDEDYPARILAHYNEGITDPKKRLKIGEVKKLKSLVETYGDLKLESDTAPKRHIDKNNVNVNSSGTMTQAPLEFDNESKMLDYILENQGVRDDKRMRVIQMFEAQKHDLISSPQSFWYFLEDSLTPQVAHAAYHAFMRMGPKYMMGWQYRGAPSGPMFGMQGGQAPQQGYGMPPQFGGGGNTIQDYIGLMMVEDRMDERKMRRHQTTMGDYMTMNFQRMTDGQNNGQMNPMTLAAMGMGAETVYDEDGRVKGVRIIPGANKNNDNALLTTFMNNTQSMINTLITNRSGDDKYDKVVQWMIELAKNKNDPVQMAKEMKELVSVFGGGSKTLEETKLLLDTKLALKHEDRDDKKLEHEWDLQRLEKTDQTDMMKEFLKVITGAKEELIPLAMQFLKGGQASKASLQKQPMPNPYGNQPVQPQYMNPPQYEYAPPPAEEPIHQEQPQGFNQMSPEQLMQVRQLAEQRMDEIQQHVIGQIDAEFQRRNTVIQRMKQRTQEENLEFNPTRKDEPENRGMYVPMNQEQPDFGHGITPSYDPAQDAPRSDKAFVVSEDFNDQQ